MADFLLPIFSYDDAEVESVTSAPDGGDATQREGVLGPSSAPTGPSSMAESAVSTGGATSGVSVGPGTGDGEGVSAAHVAAKPSAAPPTSTPSAPSSTSSTSPTVTALRATKAVAHRSPTGSAGATKGPTAKAKPTAPTAPGKAPATDGSGSDSEDPSTGDGTLDAFEVQRRRAVFTALLLLLEKGAADEAALERLVAPMSGEELLGVAEERALAGRCGNPLCATAHSVTKPRRKGWDPAGGFVEPGPPTHFCSSACEAYVEGLAERLGDPLERLQPGVRQLLGASHGDRPGSEGVAAQGGGVATMLADVQERDPGVARAEAEAGGKQLDRRAAAAAARAAAAAKRGEAAAAAAVAEAGAVEGYLPGTARRQEQLKQKAVATGAGAAPSGVTLQPVAAEEPGSTGVEASATADQPSASLPDTPSAPATASVPAPEAGPAPEPEPKAEPKPAPKPLLKKQSAAKVVLGGAAAAAKAAAEAAEAAARAPGAEEEEEPSTKAASGAGEGGAEGERRRVTFAPKVEFQMPAAPGGGAGASGAPPQQPVLVFEVEGEDGAGAGGGAQGRGPSVGPRGVLRVTEAAEALQGAGLSDDALAQALQAPAPPTRIPRALRMWFPPEAGGIGVSRKPGGTQPPQPRRAAPSAQGPAAAAAAFKQSPSAAAAASASTAGAAVSANKAASSVSASASTRGASAGSAASGGGGGTAAGAGGAGAAAGAGAGAGGGLRRFLPQAPPRRRVVYYDPAGAGAGDASPSPSSSSTSAATAVTSAASPSASPQPAAPAAASSEATSAPSSAPSPSDAPADTAAGPASPAPPSPAAAPAAAASRPPVFVDRPPPWAEPQSTTTTSSSATPASSIHPGKMHVVHIRSAKRPPGGGVPIPPEAQPYFSDEEEEELGGRGGRSGGHGAEDDDEDEGEEEDQAFVHDDRDADEMADDLYAGTLRAVDEEEEEQEQERERAGAREEEAEEEPEPRRVAAKGKQGSGSAAPAPARAVAGSRAGVDGKAPQRSKACAAASAPGAAKSAATAVSASSAKQSSAGAKAAAAGAAGAAGGGSRWKEQRRQEQLQASARPTPGGVAVVGSGGKAPLSGLHAPPPPVTAKSSPAAAAKPATGGAVASAEPGASGKPLTAASASSQAPGPASSAPAPPAAAPSDGATARRGEPRPGDPGVASTVPGAGAKGSGAEGVSVEGPDRAKGPEGPEGPDGLGGLEGLEEPEDAWLRDDLDSEDSEDAETASNASSADDYNYKSMLPYFRRTTKHYHTVLSPFNQVHMALVGWVNSRTVAFVVGVGLGPLQDPGPALPDSAYGEQGMPDPGSLQARGVLLQLLAAPLRESCSALAVRVPQSDIDRKVTALVSTFRLSGPVPSFKPAQWHLLALALLHALSLHHMPALRPELFADAEASRPRCGGRTVRAESASPRLLQALARTGFDVHYLGALVLHVYLRLHLDPALIAELCDDGRWLERFPRVESVVLEVEVADPGPGHPVPPPDVLLLPFRNAAPEALARIKYLSVCYIVADQALDVGILAELLQSVPSLEHSQLGPGAPESSDATGCGTVSSALASQPRLASMSLLSAGWLRCIEPGLQTRLTTLELLSWDGTAISTASFAADLLPKLTALRKLDVWSAGTTSLTGRDVCSLLDGAAPSVEEVNVVLQWYEGSGHFTHSTAVFADFANGLLTSFKLHSTVVTAHTLLESLSAAVMACKELGPRLAQLDLSTGVMLVKPWPKDVIAALMARCDTVRVQTYMLSSWQRGQASGPHWAADLGAELGAPDRVLLRSGQGPDVAAAVSLRPPGAASAVATASTSASSAAQPKARTAGGPLTHAAAAAAAAPAGAAAAVDEGSGSGSGRGGLPRVTGFRPIPAAGALLLRCSSEAALEAVAGAVRRWAEQEDQTLGESGGGGGEGQDRESPGQALGQAGRRQQRARQDAPLYPDRNDRDDSSSESGGGWFLADAARDPDSSDEELTLEKIVALAEEDRILQELKRDGGRGLVMAPASLTFWVAICQPALRDRTQALEAALWGQEEDGPGAGRSPSQRLRWLVASWEGLQKLLREGGLGEFPLE
ncbi:hypothetical protein HYH03_005468 [Edaphochlamys debaryana]|uniref:protein-serine/threonine phosphatase n=1 Tax=Edaphochlamys debaryana TaxID=47281 RepID=A0A836C2F9_9CHLO|nr:hypothetical protein HYH03_005468 [Edaphochlamys debaryana]|eukprot:KAG2496648.1 hypothetical protein HYH03_005468 [Edaphochlamys debaryana]